MSGRGSRAAFMGWALLLVAPLALNARIAVAQEDEAPEPYIPYHEVAPEESAMERDQRTCDEPLGYLGCAQMQHGLRGAVRPLKPQIFGALAVSASTMKYATAINEKSEEPAKQAALVRCRATGA